MVKTLDHTKIVPDISSALFSISSDVSHIMCDMKLSEEHTSDSEVRNNQLNQVFQITDNLMKGIFNRLRIPFR